MVRDAGDKLPPGDRAPIESAIDELKKAIERNDTVEIKRAMESLNTAQHRAAEAMYKAANTAGGATGGGPQGGPGEGPQGGAQPGGGASQGDVIDAEVVEEEKK
jgi:molecular chaperone DnaK